MSDLLGSPSGPSRARAYRTAREQRSQRRHDLAVIVVAIVVVLASVYVLADARSIESSLAGGGVGPTPPPITVTFGTPSISSISCGDGGSVYAERIGWVNASEPLTTGEVVPRVYEIADGDFVNDPGSTPNVTASNLCAGATPTTPSRWYAVLVDPSGANTLSYTVAGGWAAVGSGPTNIAILDDSALVVVMNPSLSGGGYGLRIVGFSNGAEVQGSIVL